MKKVVFIVTHLCSGSSDLMNVLNENPRIDIKKTDTVYDHPDTLNSLFNLGHKLDNTAAVYGDQLFYNISLSCKRFYDFSKFVYLIRRPDPTIAEIVANPNFSYSIESASRYYCFRLRRICEMARKTPGSVFLTWEDLVYHKGHEVLEKYFKLKDPLNPCNPTIEKPRVDIPIDILERCEASYERHLYYTNQLDLRRVQ